MHHPAWTMGARTGPIRRFRQMVWFACEGLIALYDERKPAEDYTVVTPDEFLERAAALNAFGKKEGRHDGPKWMRQESRQNIQAAADMHESVKEAKQMGDPSDPEVQAFWSRHRRSNTVSMSRGAANWEHGKPRQSLEQMAAEAKGDKQLVAADLQQTDLQTMAEIGRKLPRKLPRKGKLLLDL